MNYPAKWIATGCGSYRELHEGVLQCTWRDAANVQHRRSFNGTPAEAQAYLQAQRARRTRAPMGLPVSVDWEDALRLYRERMAQRANTDLYVECVMGALEALRLHCRCGLADVSPVHIDAWLGAIASRGREARRPGWAATANKYRLQIAAFFHYLHRRRLLPTNPVAATEPFRVERHVRASLSPDDYAALWRASEPPVRDLFDFLLLTGVRIGEAVAMKRTDVEGGTWLIRKRKGHNQLAIPLVGELGAIVARQPLHADGLVWRRFEEQDRPLAAGYVRTLLRSRCKRAKVPVLTTHGLRHMLASWAQSVGVSRDAVQAALGHESPQTTAIYMHGNTRAVLTGVQDAVAKLRSEAIAKLA